MTEVGWTELLSRAFCSPMTPQVIFNEIENTTINRHPEEYYLAEGLDYFVFFHYVSILSSYPEKSWSIIRGVAPNIPPGHHRPQTSSTTVVYCRRRRPSSPQHGKAVFHQSGVSSRVDPLPLLPPPPPLPLTLPPSNRTLTGRQGLLMVA